MATARAKTTPENNDLIVQMRKNNRAAHALVAFFDVRMDGRWEFKQP